MPVCTTCYQAPVTTADVETLIDDQPVIYPAGQFIPASTGEPFPDRYLNDVVAGAAAGNITVTGIRVADEIESVVAFLLGIPSDLTSEFTITAADTINNTGGTNTTGMVLVVNWHRRGYDLAALAFDNVVDEKAAMPMYAPASWPSVNINVLALASSFGSGTVRLECTTNSVTVNLAVAAFYAGVAFPNVAFSPGNAALGSTFQFAMRRKNSGVAGNLAERFCILAVYLTEGV
jgi:hypothetical protein